MRDGLMGIGHRLKYGIPQDLKYNCSGYKLTFLFLVQRKQKNEVCGMLGGMATFGSNRLLPHSLHKQRGPPAALCAKTSPGSETVF
jgi:hypothetical protein